MQMRETSIALTSLTAPPDKVHYSKRDPMAPDIASLPPSPRPSAPPSANTSRRPSHIMPPPPPLRSPVISGNESNVPLRHPRPLTAAELYLECEKEQEAVVNRLTRELTALRAQSASVASNHSISSNSTAASISLLPVDISDPNPTHQMTGATHPTPSRRHRSSSSMSGRSNVLLAPSTATHSAAGSNQAQAGGSHAGGSTLHGISQASADRAAAAGNLSRQPSQSGRSGASTPARQSMDFSRSAILARPSISRENTSSSTLAQPGTPALAAPSSSINTAMQHFADTSAYRTEMEIVKAENDVLRQRVRALERALQTRRRDSSSSHDPSGEQGERRSIDLRTDRRDVRSGEQIPTRGHNIGSPPPSAGFGVAAWAANDGGIGGVAGPRERSESQSTTASSRRGIVPGVTDDDLRLGESASNIGVGARGGGA